MAKKKDTARHILKQVGRMKSKTNWVKSQAMTQAQLKASIIADADEAGMVIDWHSATVEMPQPKAVLNMRVDRDLLDFFKKKGRGYQTRINAVLRSYVDQTTSPPRQ